jgi:hypothetical protein
MAQRVSRGLCDSRDGAGGLDAANSSKPLALPHLPADGAATYSASFGPANSSSCPCAVNLYFASFGPANSSPAPLGLIHPPPCGGGGGALLFRGVGDDELSSPSPLEGEGRGGGYICDGSIATPLPPRFARRPPPQGGRWQRRSHSAASARAGADTSATM